MIVEDITDTECSLCTDPVSNHSSEGIFHIHHAAMEGLWLKDGEEAKRRVQPEGFASEEQECFLTLLDYFSSGSEFPTRAVPQFLCRILIGSYRGLHLYHSIPLTSVAIQCHISHD